MGYKDKTKERDATRSRVKRHRQKGVTPSRNVTPFEANVTPSSPTGTLPPERVASIKGILASRARIGCPDDSKERWEKAVKYREFELGGS